MPKYLVTATIPVHAECVIEAADGKEAHRLAGELTVDHFTLSKADTHILDGVYKVEHTQVAPE